MRRVVAQQAGGQPYDIDDQNPPHKYSTWIDLVGPTPSQWRSEPRTSRDENDTIILPRVKGLSDSRLIRRGRKDILPFPQLPQGASGDILRKRPFFLGTALGGFRKASSFLQRRRREFTPTRLSCGSFHSGTTVLRVLSWAWLLADTRRDPRLPLFRLARVGLLLSKVAFRLFRIWSASLCAMASIQTPIASAIRRATSSTDSSLLTSLRRPCLV